MRASGSISQYDTPNGNRRDQLRSSVAITSPFRCPPRPLHRLAMPYRAALIAGSVYMVRWELPTIDDLDTSLGEVRAAAQAAGGPIVSIWMVGDAVPTPDYELKRSVAQRLPELLELSEVHNVIEGKGWKTSILRVFLSRLAAARGMKERLFIHRSLEEALLALVPQLRRRQVPPRKILEDARRAGLVRAAAPT